MSNIVLKAENISKQYRLGQLGTGTISHDLNRAWAKMRGKEDPYLKVGDVNDRSKTGGSDYVWSLKDISFEVKQGEVVGVIGKNGAGKSTLLKIFSQVTTPTTGQVKVKGRIAALLEVGTGFHPDLSGRENIYLNGAILGMTKTEITKKLEEIVEFSGVAKYLDTPTKRYSSGMTVRLGFAIAAHLEPEILIVDEVLAVGDAEFQKKCLGKMKDVSAQGRTVLFVSHNMAAIQQLCTSGILLINGTLGGRSTISDIIKQYTSDHQLTGAVVNFSTSTKRSGDGSFRFRSVGMYDNTNQPKNEFSIGDDVVFELHVENFSAEKKVELAIQIKTTEGMPVFHMMCRDSNFIPDFNSRIETFTATLKDLRLFPGNYSVTLTCASTTGHVLYDNIEEAISLTILDGGRYTTRSLPRTAGLFFMNPEWKKADVYS